MKGPQKSRSQQHRRRLNPLGGMHSVAWVCLLAYGMALCHGDDQLRDVFEKRGFDPAKINLPAAGVVFPVARFAAPTITTIATFDLFPEGPSYRPQDGSVFFAGNIGLRRIAPKTHKLHTVIEKPGGGGTHLLPDGSILLVGQIGLRRVYPNGKIELLADGKEIGGGNDLTMGIHGEVYFTVPKKQAVYRLTPGPNGKLERVTKKGGNGLDVDPTGKLLFVNRGVNVDRYPIQGPGKPLGKPDLAFVFDKSLGGGDGCTFDAWGNYYVMHFKTGIISVVDPLKKKRIAEINPGVSPATNLAFGGRGCTTLYVTAGVPRVKNCRVLKIDLGVTGFCGHVGAIEYPALRVLDEKANKDAF